MPKINPVSLPPLEPMKAEVGNGIAAFSQIESFLALLYAQFMHPAPRALSLLSFDAARHIEIKCRVLKVVGQQCLSGHHLSDFEKLMQRVKRKTEMRNKLAHWHVAHWHKNQPVSSVEEIRQMEPRLIPPYFSSGNLDFSPDQPIGMSELKDFSSGCRKLATDLSAFLTGRAFNAD